MKNSLILLLLSGLFIVLGCTRTILYRDQKVVLGTKPTAFFPFNVHGGETRFLIVNGKRYNRVRGEQPCYLDVPELDSILFVTEEGPEKVRIHLVNLKTKNEIRFKGLPPFDEGFGHGIGGLPETRFSEWIERLEKNTLVVAGIGMNEESFYYLDLKGKKVEKIEALRLDINGAVTNRVIFHKNSLK